MADTQVTTRRGFSKGALGALGGFAALAATGKAVEAAADPDAEMRRLIAEWRAENARFCAGSKDWTQEQEDAAYAKLVAVEDRIYALPTRTAFGTLCKAMIWYGDGLPGISGGPREGMPAVQRTICAEAHALMWGAV